MTTTKLPKVDYLSLLGYIQGLGIRVYDINQVQFDDIVGQGASMLVFKGYLSKDTDTPASEPIPVALKTPSASINERTTNVKVSEVLNDVRQEIRMMKHFDGHPNIIQLYGVAFNGLNPVTIVELATEGSVTEYLASKLENEEPVDWDTEAAFAMTSRAVCGRSMLPTSSTGISKATTSSSFRTQTMKVSWLQRSRISGTARQRHQSS